MCTSIVVNKNKTLVGWNLDILDMEHRIREDDDGVYIEIFDDKEGWLPLFGANSRGEFIGMPTCHPFDDRSNPPQGEECLISMMLGIELLLRKRTFEETKELVFNNDVYSVPGNTFMSSLSDKEGNVLHIIPGQGYKYYDKPEYKILTNFSPFKGDSEKHPWMGMDRYLTAERLLSQANSDFDTVDCFEVLKACSQEVCPTVVSMVFNVSEMTVYWCENRCYDKICKHEFK